MSARIVKLKSRAQWQAIGPLRVDLVGMSDARFALGRCINACLRGLFAELYATARDDDYLMIDAGQFGTSEIRLPDIYSLEVLPESPMFCRALQLYPEFRLATGLNITINCQYGSGGLSTSSSVSAAINAFLRYIFQVPYDAMDMVRRVVESEPFQYGLQDQLAVVLGGINMWETEPVGWDFDKMTALDFNRAGIRQYPIALGDGMDTALAESLIIYESGIISGAKEILHEVSRSFESDPIIGQTKFDKLRDLASDLYEVLSKHCNHSSDLADRLGPLFNEIRAAHESLHPSVSNERLTDLFDAALSAGATGARYTGAGGRGCILVACPSHKRARIEAALNDVDTPSPDDPDNPLRGRIQRFSGFDPLGAHCWPSSF